jgi:hypothetical protein
MTTREPTFYQAVASDVPTGHRVGVDLAEVLVGPLPAMRNRALLQVDLAVVEPALAGTAAVFLELPPATSVVDLRLDASGKYEFVRVGEYVQRGKVFRKRAGGLRRFAAILAEETEEPLGDRPEEFARSTRLRLGGAVRLTKSDELAARRTLSWFIGDEPCWVQAGRRVDYAVTAAPWLYCGTVESDAYVGVVHAFFHREKRLLRNVFECT